MLAIADGPLTAPDVIVQREVRGTLRPLQQRLHLSVIMITHDISVVADACESVVVAFPGLVPGPSIFFILVLWTGGYRLPSQFTARQLARMAAVQMVVLFRRGCAVS